MRWQRGKGAALAIFALGLASASARADPIEATLKDAGLWGGPFAADCSQPAGPGNWLGNFASDGAQVAFTWAGGAAPPRVYLVQDARKQPDGSLVLKLEARSNYAILTTIYALGQNPDAFRPMSSRVNTSGSEVTTIDEGVVLKSKTETPWYVRCRK
jgi:hypothetical protein